MDFLNHYLQIIILGIVEGVTEFLPISSTGHLLIAEHLMGTQMPDIFNVVIQAGAILAVVFIYWHKIVTLFSNLDQHESRSYLLKVLGAFLVTMLLVLVLTVKFKLKLTESLLPVAWATFVGGLVIFGIEYFAKNLYPHEDVSWFEAILVGAAQVVAAIFPGASRSGATIMSGLAVGMKRPSVTEFTFLVGIPTMFAASVYDIFKNRKDLHGAGHQLIFDTAIGFFVSMIVAFFVVKWLLRFVQSHTFNGFAIYRVILGGALLIGLYTNAIPNVTNEDKPKISDLGQNPIFAPATPATNAEAAPVSPVAPAATNTDSTPAAPAFVPSTNSDAVPRALPVTADEMANESRPIESHPIDSSATNGVTLTITPGVINQPVFNVRKVMTNQTATPEPPATSNVPAPQN